MVHISFRLVKSSVEMVREQIGPCKVYEKYAEIRCFINRDIFLAALKSGAHDWSDKIKMKHKVYMESTEWKE